MAIIAFIASFFIPLLGIILGHISLSQIKRTGENGRGLGLAGTIIGYVLTAFYVLWIGFVIVISVIAAASSSGYSYSSY
ncbi:hypothetical protein BMH25_01630 [Leucobacter sp. OLCALW19]|nr:DUF4190 domain-containing protein [Leucobacter sp. OLCALW19]PII85706.1 hypothetical protein BMH25_01630 [Leucobacter sp. OLCALW19]